MTHHSIILATTPEDYAQAGKHKGGQWDALEMLKCDEWEGLMGSPLTEDSKIPKKPAISLPYGITRQYFAHQS
jgi:hypothetical protein